MDHRAARLGSGVFYTVSNHRGYRWCTRDDYFDGVFGQSTLLRETSTDVDRQPRDDSRLQGLSQIVDSPYQEDNDSLVSLNSGRGADRSGPMGVVADERFDVEVRSSTRLLPTVVLGVARVMYDGATFLPLSPQMSAAA